MEEEDEAKDKWVVGRVFGDRQVKDRLSWAVWRQPPQSEPKAWATEMGGPAGKVPASNSGKSDDLSSISGST